MQVFITACFIIPKPLTELVSLLEALKLVRVTLQPASRLQDLRSWNGGWLMKAKRLFICHRHFSASSNAHKKVSEFRDW